MDEPRKCLVAIRIRGTIDLRTEIHDTMKILDLNYNCNATILDNRPSYLGMLRKSQSYLTWGEPTIESIALLLKKRGRITGNKKLNDEHAQHLGFKSLDKLSEALQNLSVEFKNLDAVKPVFRLHPPRKGYRGTVKKNFRAGGAAGYRGEAINDLIKRMT